MAKKAIVLLLLLAAAVPTKAGKVPVGSFREMCDSLSARMERRTSQKIRLRLVRVEDNGASLSFLFSETLGSYAWRPGDEDWFREQIKETLPSQYSSRNIGSVSGRGISIKELTGPGPSKDGRPNSDRYRMEDPRTGHIPIVREVGRQDFNKGLTGRTIALWQSHGRYFDEEEACWKWQRTTLLRTVEDMYTQSYVLPFLIPMLENAGAYVMTPRERDIQPREVIIDNDPAFLEPREGMMRTSGIYKETGAWEDAGTGFADAKPIYIHDDNPFTMGSARKAGCVSSDIPTATVTWTPDIQEKGDYAVYISYKTVQGSSSSAHYTVRYLGGEKEFLVNQGMGGGTWIYLGTFLFDKGTSGCVILDNRGKSADAVITADAVKIGGGMGKIARGLADAPDSTYAISGLPSYAEGALYWMQWAGMDTTVTRLHENDYKNDYGDRGAWVGNMSGGSKVNPDTPGRGIPVDMSLAFHSDAGFTPNDSIIGTLSIYTLKEDGKRKLPNGEDRMQARQLADFVQSEIVDDIREKYEPKWSRRMLWDRSYSECRTTSVPGMLLELLSHQNFADMKYGLDPSFRFTVCRSVYKGILKYLSNRYGCNYQVQPLPVNSFAATFSSAPANGSSADVLLSWKPTIDSLEKTAVSKGYLLYTRIDDGGFDNGQPVQVKTLSHGRIGTGVRIDPGHVYDFKVVAFNDGGLSFPSEVLSVGIPLEGELPLGGKAVMVVNNFDRISAPAWFDTPSYAGFNDAVDSGVPYMREIEYIGDQFDFTRTSSGEEYNPDFGYCYSDMAATVRAGNTFDYPRIHGKALLKSGYPFYSVSSAAFRDEISSWSYAFAADIICGKQVTTMMGRGAVPPRFQVFPKSMRAAISDFTAHGGNIIVSGSNIGTDVWDQIYPNKVDSTDRRTSIKFVQETLGYKWLTNYATKSGQVWAIHGGSPDPAGISKPVSFHMERNGEIYNVENADGIVPASDNGHVFLRYTDTNIPAAVGFEGNHYKAACFGFPLEIISSPSNLTKILSATMEFFLK